MEFWHILTVSFMCTSSENFPTFEALQIPEDGNVRMRMQALVRNKRIQDEYNTNFPEPDKTTDPLLYLCWWTTRFNPSERPTMQEVSQFLMKNHGKIVEEIKRRSICN